MKIKLGKLKRVIKEEIERANLIKMWEMTGLFKNLVKEEEKFRAARFLDNNMSEALKDIKKNKMSKKEARERIDIVIVASKPLLKRK